MFTRNIREASRPSALFQPFLRWLYHKTRLPLALITITCGGFPVKLTTFIGKPIPFDESLDSESLAKLVQQRMEDLIEAHQPKPGNIIRAIKERFSKPSDSAQLLPSNPAIDVRKSN